MSAGKTLHRGHNTKALQHSQAHLLSHINKINCKSCDDIILINNAHEKECCSYLFFRLREQLNEVTGAPHDSKA